MVCGNLSDLPFHPPRWGSRWALAIVYTAAALSHLATPDSFLRITPDWVPFPRQTIIATGICELAGAVGILTGRYRRITGIALALYAICVYPANIKHALDGLSAGGHDPLGWWYHIPRLALQPVMVWWALFAGGVVDWPFRRRR
ncbi:hypothetical protein CPY51_28110 [Rhizobium tubonense]|uniref:DoxX family protein n=1 Tax=Rhizobium tubonense TaxID=484088 RepID=A0A2W4C780_9HYPH|nr:hypothetical protein CPY51_28110 [Rhizobium tubonense]